MPTTNVPLPTFTNAGLLVPTEPEVLAGVFADWTSAFAPYGKALNTELTTPQGQLAQSQAYMLTVLNAAMLQLIRNIDPQTSQGAFQDALGKIYFLTRQAATYATVDATVRGVAGQTLPAGAQAKAADGSIWATIGAVTFDPAGSADVTFRATVSGAGPAVGVNGLTIYQQQTGWESVTNASASTPGTDVESRQAFESRRAASVSIGGQGTAAAVRAAVANVPGVIDTYVYDNGSDSAISYGTTSYPIPAHSIALTVAGGDSQAIAQAVQSTLDAGCGMPTSAGLGTLVTEIVEDRVNYAQPYPQYPRRFVRPAVTPIYVRVAVANLTSLPNTYVTDVQQAVATAVSDGFSTADGRITVGRARIGGQIVAAEYGSAVLALGNVTPISITIGTTANPMTGQALTMGIDQLPTCAAGNVTVVAVDV